VSSTQLPTSTAHSENPTQIPSATPSDVPSFFPSFHPSSESPSTFLTSTIPSISPSKNPSGTVETTQATTSGRPTISSNNATIIYAKQNVNLALNAEGVTEENKDQVCEAYASKISGMVKYCSFDPLSPRRLLQSQKLYVQIEVNNEVKVDISAIDKDIDVEGVTVTDVQVELSIIAPSASDVAQNKDSRASPFIPILILVIIAAVLLLAVVMYQYYKRNKFALEIDDVNESRVEKKIIAVCI